jgi:STE24 endopeptidase
MNPSLAMTLALALALLANLGLKLWLALRQARHVAQHQHQVPAAFADSLSLSSHQKAAQYTLAKSRLSLWDMALEALVLLGWTLLGGLEWLNQTLLDWLYGDRWPDPLALVPYADLWCGTTLWVQQNDMGAVAQ